jgi:hypothetical protein
MQLWLADGWLHSVLQLCLAVVGIYAGCLVASPAPAQGFTWASVKTASVHVSHILAKLEVRTRVEAAAIAHRLAPPTPAAPSELPG